MRALTRKKSGYRSLTPDRGGWFAVVFRMVVFRPFSSEVILAKVKSSDEDGIRRASSLSQLISLTYFEINTLNVIISTILPTVSVGFFDDMYIPTTYLPQPSAL